MTATVEVRIELGHRAKFRDVRTQEGHTHDWMVYVKGVEGISIYNFVDKVVFHLHESYDQPKRVIRSPPYKVEESGFAGFNMPIDVYFRNKEEPKQVRFEYDLFLHIQTMPPVNHTRLEKLTFTNPTEDFREKLLAAGAVLIKPLDRHSSKERSRGIDSPHSKKERIKSKEHSKRREGTSGRQEEKKKSSVLSKKEGRIAAKDIKRHEEEFKHPKLPESSKINKESPRDGTNRDRGRSEKRASSSDRESKKKKKRKHSSPPSQAQGSRPSSLNIPSASAPPAKKEKVRRIKEKPDLMAGLFAPENSINMNQIKKEKMKAESIDSRVKKEKHSTTPTGNPDLSQTEDRVATHSAKKSPTGNLTLKIKKDRISASAEKDAKKKAKQSEKAKSEKIDGSALKPKKRSKEIPEVKNIKIPEVSKHRSSVISSSSSSSDSDMDISSSSDSSPERHHHKPSTKSSHKNAVKKIFKDSNAKRESSVSSEKSNKKMSSQGISKGEKMSIEKSRSRKESPSLSKAKDKSKASESPKLQISNVIGKKISEKKEQKLPAPHEKDKPRQVSRKPKKDRHSPRDKGEKIHSKESKSKSKTLIKEERRSPFSDALPLKTEPRFSKSPLTQRTASPSTSIKSKKSSKSPERKKKRTDKRSSEKKLSKSSESKITKSNMSLKQDIKNGKPKSSKSKTSIPTDSSSDSDVAPDLFSNPPPRLSPIEVKTTHLERSREDSLSSSSSSSAGENTPHPYSSSSSSADSSDEDDLQKIHASAALTEPVLSPIDSHYDTSYKDAKTAFSGDSFSPGQEGISQAPQENSAIEDHRHGSPLVHDSPHMNFSNHDMYTSSDEEGGFASPLEKPFQDHNDAAFEDDNQPPEENREEPANIIIENGSSMDYPHMTQELYSELRELQEKLSYVKDVNRLSKIANIVHKSQKLLQSDEYLDFDLCALDERTIHKIKKELKAV